MRICTRKSDGYLLEYQSGSGSLQTLIDNAINAGYQKSEIEALELPEEDGSFLLEQYFKDRRSYRDKRGPEYPSVTDQLDALLKQLNYMQMSQQTNCVDELDIIINKWLAVKAKYPKEDVSP